MHEVLVNRLGGLSLPKKSVIRLTDLPDMTLDAYRGHNTTIQQQQQQFMTWPLLGSNGESTYHRCFLKQCSPGCCMEGIHKMDLLATSLPDSAQIRRGEIFLMEATLLACFELWFKFCRTG